MRSLLLAMSVLAVTAGSASAQDDRLENCGFTFPVGSYVANVSGLNIELTANDRLVINGRVLAEHNPWRRNEAPLSWFDSANTAEIAVGRREFLVRTSRNDCIDYQSTRVYVLNEGGELRATFVYPHMWERVLLSNSANDILYTTDYYCEFAEGAPAGQVWVHVLRAGATEFVRESRERAEVCAGNEAKAVGSVLVFMPMQPFPPAQTRSE
jgi:hypothetical protein